MKRRILLALLCPCLVHAAYEALPAAGRPIGFEDLMKMKRISDVTVSPAGAVAAYTVKGFDLENDTEPGAIWLTDLVTGETSRLTTGDGSDHAPAWSPDGRWIAFISKRGGENQVWVVDPEGGEARQVTSLSTGADRVVWSPDGSTIAITSSVYPDCPGDDCNRTRLEAREEDGSSGRVIDRLLYRHWNTWRDGRWEHLFVTEAGGGTPQDLTPGVIDVPPVSIWGDVFAAFSPNGSEVVYPCNRDSMPAASTNIDLFSVAVQGGETTKLTGNPADDNTPVFSPGGNLLAYRAMSRPGYESDRYRLMVREFPDGRDRELAATLDRSVGSDLCWAPDGRSLFFSTSDLGKTTMFQVWLADGSWERIPLDGDCHGTKVCSDPPMLVFLREHLEAPAELFAVGLEPGEKGLRPAGEPRKLTAFNDGVLAELEVRPGESFRFEGAAGDSIQAWLVKPPGWRAGKRYPVVFLIHGGPQGAFTDEFHFRWNAQMFAAPGYVVVMPNFTGSTGFGQTFTDRIRLDWGGNPYWDIMRCVDFVTERFGFVDPDRIAAAGASYGGYMMNWIAGHTDRFDCIVSHAGLFDLPSEYGATEELWFPEWDLGGPPWVNPALYEDLSPSTYAANFKTPVLVITGELDFRVPYTQGLGMFTALQRQGIPSRLLVFPDEDHFVSKPRNRRLWWSTVLGWLDRYLREK